MGSILMGAVAGVGLQEVFTTVKGEIPNIIKVFSNVASEKLQETIKRIKPAVDEMCELSLESSPEEWLQSMKGFQGKLADGFKLIEECQKTSFLEVHKKYRNAGRIASMENYIVDYINTKILLDMALHVKKSANMACKNDAHTQERIENILEEVKNISSKCDAHAPDSLKILFEEVKNLLCKIEAHAPDSVLFRRENNENSGANAVQNELRLYIPNMPSFLVGLDVLIEKLMEYVLDPDVSLVGITGMSGIGKSTLASAFCHHNQIGEHFEKRVIYITVSESPKIMDIIEKMWEIMVDCPKPGFKNIEDARNQLQYQITSGRNQRTLVVLDDVCDRSDLQKLLFEGEHYKTLVTTRDEKVICKEHNARVYELQCLEKDHALSVFCHYAFGQPEIPDSHDKELVKQVQAECGGLPLALQVIGSSLRGEPSPVWEIAKKKLSRGEPISRYHGETLLERLKTTSIDVLQDDLKQCFLDLAAFPQGRTISANVLLAIWVYVREMDWDDAFMVLLEFEARSLL